RARAAARAGGLERELPELTACPLLVAAVREGELDEQVLDIAVRRILRQKVELGLLDPDFDAGATGEASDLDSAENRAFARRMAEESTILLDNSEGVLPLAAPADGGAPASIALIGPAAVQPRSFLGCYSFTNHVLSRLEDNGSSVDVPTLTDALTAEFPQSAITTVGGTGFSDGDTSQIAEAV